MHMQQRVRQPPYFLLLVAPSVLEGRGGRMPTRKGCVALPGRLEGCMPQYIGHMRRPVIDGDTRQFGPLSFLL